LYLNTLINVIIYLTQRRFPQSPKEHEPNHIHALYGEYTGEFNISTLEMIQGDLPPKAHELVKEWLQLYKDDLQDMWDKQFIYKLPPLK